MGGLLQCHNRGYAIIVECVTEIGSFKEIFINYGLPYFSTDGNLDPAYLYGLTDERDLSNDCKITIKYPPESECSDVIM
jgi:hypothetical protein